MSGPGCGILLFVFMTRTAYASRVPASVRRAESWVGK